MTEIEILERRILRERQARIEAEKILEQKALELYYLNQELIQLNGSLEKKVAERTQDLNTSQSRLSSLISNMNAAILVEDETRHIALANKAFCDMFGIPAPPEALVGGDCVLYSETSKLLFESPEEFVARVEEILTENKNVSGDVLKMVDKRVIERDYIPIELENRHIGHMWKYTDITNQYYAHLELQHSEDKYRGIMENMELGLLEVDTEGGIMKAYPRFCDMTGYRNEELVGKSAADIFLPLEYLPILEQQAKDREKGKAGVYEVELIKKNKERIWVLISGAPITDLNGNLVGSVGIHYDVTHEKNLQRDLDLARQRAEDAQEAEKQFLANMSHEMRTPLNAIIGMSHLLYDTMPTEEQYEYLSVLRNSAEILRGLITDVLDLAKIRTGNLEVQEKEFDLVGLVKSITKSFQLRVEDRPLSITCKIDPNLTKMMIGDDLLLNQILMNLIGNAEKFTPEGKILIDVKIIEREDNKLKLRFSVKDTGIGIPKDKLEIIFQSFRQVDGDIRRRFGGTGLGLAITKQIIEIQGGSIEVKSIENKGSIFTFDLYFKESDRQNSVEIINVEPLKLNTESKHILVVEDNYMNRKYVSTLLKKWKFNFVMAFNGRDALKVCLNQKFDLILMDIQMPELDGYETSIALRNTENPNRNVPIIALTASALLSQKDKAFSAGMNDYLSKPFKPDQLIEKISIWVGLEEPKSEKLAQKEEKDSNIFEFNHKLDYLFLKDVYGDDYEYAIDMFETFSTNTMQEVPKLDAAFDEKNIKEIKRLAHKLKPSFGIVGLTDLEKILTEIENTIEDSNIEDIKKKFKKFKEKLPAATEIVTADLENMKAFLDNKK